MYHIVAYLNFAQSYGIIQNGVPRVVIETKTCLCGMADRSEKNISHYYHLLKGFFLSKKDLLNPAKGLVNPTVKIFLGI